MHNRDVKFWTRKRFELDPAELSPEERLNEIALILARGVQRLQKRQLLDGILAGSRPERLEVSAENVLSGGIGIWPAGPNETSRPGVSTT